jgi:hypothetical protein
MSNTEGPPTPRRHPKSLPSDVEKIPWAAAQLGVSKATGYRMAQAGKLPGAFKVLGQWRISVPSFNHEIHGADGARLQADASHKDAPVSS